MITYDETYSQCVDCNDPTAFFKETTQQDDMDGVLHCTKCNKQIKRYSVFMDDGKTLDPQPVPQSGIFDFFQQELMVGDTIAFDASYMSTSSALTEGKVLSFPEGSMVEIEYKIKNRILYTQRMPSRVVKKP